MNAGFNVAVTRDFLTRSPGMLEPELEHCFSPHPAIAWEGLPGDDRLAAPEAIAGFDAAISLHTRFDASTFRQGANRLTVIARWGVGYDYIDVDACTRNDVLLCITPDAVRRPVAEAAMAMLLAITRQLLVKDRLVREGRWNEKAGYRGIALGGKVLGTIGLGNIATQLIHVARPFGFSRILATDPIAGEAKARALGVELVGLETLLRESDFVCINCPLNEKTRGLIGEPQLRLMKPTAFLINTARGGIVSTEAITRALAERWIAGAGLDVLDPEPFPADHPLTKLENVILSPHATAWTDELVQENGRGACRNVIAVLRGEVPAHAVNPDVVRQPGFQKKLRALRERWRRAASTPAETA
jgi:phosphoglycerate dehydrogenase-like enzyme